MERANRILVHPLWLEEIRKIQELEKDRIFCKHTVAHFLDVARLAYIENLEKNLSYSKELIYAAALLHDIGRAQQYLDGTPHDEAGVMLSRPILQDCGFTAAEQTAILEAIAGHRKSQTGSDLPGLIYRADKACRMCMFCKAQKDCNWSDEKKNLILKV